MLLTFNSWQSLKEIYTAQNLYIHQLTWRWHQCCGVKTGERINWVQSDDLKSAFINVPQYKGLLYSINNCTISNIVEIKKSIFSSVEKQTANVTDKLTSWALFRETLLTKMIEIDIRMLQIPKPPMDPEGAESSSSLNCASTSTTGYALLNPPVHALRAPLW